MPTPPLSVSLRPISPADNEPLAAIIHATLASVDFDRPGALRDDPTTNHLSGFFQRPGSTYIVAEQDGQVLGGGGIVHTDTLPADTVELARVYLAPAFRGLGIGRRLVEECLRAAANYGYRYVYLETIAELVEALPLYEKLGFQYLMGPLGKDGHAVASVWMRKELPREIA